MGEFNINKSDGSLEQTAGMPSEYPATQVMLSDGVTSVEDAVDAVANNSWVTLNANVMYRVTGGLVYISVNITNTAGSWSDLGLMPSDIKPSVNTYNCAFYRAGDGKYANLYVSANNGSVQAQSNADIPNGYIIYPKE